MGAAAMKSERDGPRIAPLLLYIVLNIFLFPAGFFVVVRVL